MRGGCRGAAESRPPLPSSTISVRGDRRTFLATTTVFDCAVSVLVHPAASPRDILSALDGTLNQWFLCTIMVSGYKLLYRGCESDARLRSAS